jgi:uncharacterized integral membrane protein
MDSHPGQHPEPEREGPQPTSPSSGRGTDGAYPGERRTRLSGALTAIGASIVALVVILIFILQNQQPAELSFLGLHGRLPLGVALLFATILGAVIVLAFGGARILQLRMVTRRARRRGAAARPPAADPGP